MPTVIVYRRYRHRSIGPIYWRDVRDAGKYEPSQLTWKRGNDKFKRCNEFGIFHFAMLNCSWKYKQGHRHCKLQKRSVSSFWLRDPAHLLVVLGPSVSGPSVTYAGANARQNLTQTRWGDWVHRETPSCWRTARGGLRKYHEESIHDKNCRSTGNLPFSYVALKCPQHWPLRKTVASQWHT